MRPSGVPLIDRRSRKEPAVPRIELEHTTVGNPRPSLNSSRLQFANRSGDLVAVFHTPFEWHMGAWGWKIDLLDRGRSVLDMHPALSGLVTAKGLYVPDGQGYQPWAHDGERLVVLSWQGPTVTYSVTARTAQKWELPGSLDDVIGSPTIDRYLVATHGPDRMGQVVLLCTTDGKMMSRTSIVSVYDHHLPCFWLPGSPIAFGIRRVGTPGRSVITFIDGVSGNLLEEYSLDSMDLVPYDYAAYADIPRDRHQLIESPGRRAAGELLDRWYRVEFRAEQRLLLLWVLRPVGDVIEFSGYPACQVEDRCAVVRIHP